MKESAVPEGSCVLFTRSGKGQKCSHIVGWAMVKEPPKSRTILGPDDRFSKLWPNERPELPNMVTFAPETIDAWDDDTFVSSKEARDLGINKLKGHFPVYVQIAAEQFKKIVALHESKRRHLKPT